MLLNKPLCRRETVVQKTLVHPIILRISVFVAVQLPVQLSVPRNIAGIRHFAVVVVERRVDRGALVGELERLIEMERIDNVRIVANLQRV